MMRDPNEVLGVSPASSAKEIRVAYRALAKKYHPDRFAEKTPPVRRRAEARMADINLAYKQLIARPEPAPPDPEGWIDPIWLGYLSRIRQEEGKRKARYARWTELERRAREQPAAVRPRRAVAPEPTDAEKVSRLAAVRRNEREARRAAAARRWADADRERTEAVGRAEDVLRSMEDLRVVLSVDAEQPRRRSFRRT